MTPSTESPRPGGNLLMASCVLLSFGAAFLGLAGLWAPYGPSLMCALFLIAAGPVIAFGKRAKVETVGWRAPAGHVGGRQRPSFQQLSERRYHAFTSKCWRRRNRRFHVRGGTANVGLPAHHAPKNA